MAHDAGKLFDDKRQCRVFSSFNLELYLITTYNQMYKKSRVSIFTVKLLQISSTDFCCSFYTLGMYISISTYITFLLWPRNWKLQVEYEFVIRAAGEDFNDTRQAIAVFAKDIH